MMSSGDNEVANNMSDEGQEEKRNIARTTSIFGNNNYSNGKRS